MTRLPVLWLALALVTSPAYSQAAEPAPVLFTNINVFDGTSEELAVGGSALIEGNRIQQVGDGIQALAHPSPSR